VYVLNLNKRQAHAGGNAFAAWLAVSVWNRWQINANTTNRQISANGPNRKRRNREPTP
jgi:hypothetical protein